MTILIIVGQAFVPAAGFPAGRTRSKASPRAKQTAWPGGSSAKRLPLNKPAEWYPGFGTRQRLPEARARTSERLFLSPCRASDTRAGSRKWPTGDPVFPFGDVYFRKSKPPEQDWERDHKTAAQIGVNVFRHWFLWGSIETSPGKHDWRDYDRMVELEAQNHIRVVHERARAGVDVG